jgi:metallo-beta-lactamase family protein
VKLKFMGATRQVTGSRYLLEAGGLRLLVDCGLFQEREFLGRNWEPFPLPLDQIDYLLLTHAHLDHSGMIPRLVRDGFGRPVLATRASVDLAEIVLRDAGHLQEEDTEFKRRRHQREGRRGPYPEVPLYSAEDAAAAMSLFRGVGYDEPVALNDQVSIRFRDAGHILGSAMLELTATEDGRTRKLVFSGDVGQWNMPLVRDPTVFEQADYIVVESTYGNRLHQDQGQVEDLLGEAINRTVTAGGNLIIPTFAIERAQELMFYLSRLVRKDRIPHLLAFLDSPMAVNATAVFLKYPECLDEETRRFLRSDQSPFAFPGLKLVRTVEESKAINRIRGSCIVMAGSGMCTGGRIKHHLEHRISRPETTVLFVGYQAAGTLGRQLLDGQEEVRIHGQQHRVRARIEQIHGFSAHADQRDLLRWLGNFRNPPRKLFVTHGEEEAALCLAGKVREERNWPVEVPEYQQEWDLA